MLVADSIVLLLLLSLLLLLLQCMLHLFVQSMGIDEDPFEFFLDLFRLSLVFQLGAAALVFYTVELGLGGNAGDAFRAVGGLFLGYMLRLGIKVEQLVSAVAPSDHRGLACKSTFECTVPGPGYMCCAVPPKDFADRFVAS